MENKLLEDFKFQIGDGTSLVWYRDCSFLSNKVLLCSLLEY